MIVAQYRKLIDEQLQQGQARQYMPAMARHRMMGGSIEVLDDPRALPNVITQITFGSASRKSRRIIEVRAPHKISRPRRPARKIARPSVQPALTVSQKPPKGGFAIQLFGWWLF